MLAHRPEGEPYDAPISPHRIRARRDRVASRAPRRRRRRPDRPSDARRRSRPSRYAAAWTTRPGSRSRPTAGSGTSRRTRAAIYILNRGHRRTAPVHRHHGRQRARVSAAALGIALHPAWPARPFVYVYVTRIDGGVPAERGPAVPQRERPRGGHEAALRLAREQRHEPQRRPDPVRARREPVDRRRARTPSLASASSAPTSAARSCGSSPTASVPNSEPVRHPGLRVRASATRSGWRSTPRPTGSGRPRTARAATTRST